MASTAARPVEIPPNRRGAQLAVMANLPAGAERKLAIQVLATAIDDLVRNRDTTDPARLATYHKARSWLVSNDRSWPYSFLNLCDLLNLPASRLRQAILARKTPISLFDEFYT